VSRVRLAVLGLPIAHSLSPTLHRAAYEVLGLDWEYEAIEIAGADLAEFVASRDESWRGLSLTMPLKRDVLPLLATRSELVTETGSANTVLFDDGGVAGFNTDVYGVTESFRRHGHRELSSVLVLGGGATAASAVVAAARMNADRVFVGVRSPERAAGLTQIGKAQGVDVLIRSLDELVQVDERLDAVISTIPNGADLTIEIDPDVVSSAALLDVAYHPWPSPLASTWPGVDVISGLEMLVLQALAQVRVFVARDPHVTLDHEDDILAAMLASAGL
jgi:shikimate dehydrogenase